LKATEANRRRELEKRLVREESIQKVIHMYMEAKLGISLYSYPYLNQQKPLVLPINVQQN
jgi:hypothetical protein